MKPDIHLIFPPQWSPFQPFLSTPALKAYLQNKGFSVRQSDWNVDFYHYFISPDRKANAINRLVNYVTNLSPEHEVYRNQAILALGILSDYDNKWKKADALRQRFCLESIEKFYASVTTFKRLLHAFSIAEPIVEVGTSSLSTGNITSDAAQIDDFCSNEENNPFLPFFHQKIAEIGNPPRYFGLSVIGAEQILASLTLAKLLKAAFPDVPVIIGGSVFSRLAEKPEIIGNLFRTYFDIILRYEGEEPLAQLLYANDPLAERTPNLCFLKGSEVIKTDLAPQLPMSELPTPDFDDLDLDAYYSPEIVLPLLTTRGCYWDKCAFCYHGMIYGDRYRMRLPKTFAEDVQKLERRYDVRHFALNDEAIPPKLFDGLPKAIENKRYYFTGLYKFEKYFKPKHYKGMYELGFRSLYIGLETASERVQKHMKKDNTQDVMLANLQDAHDAGIWNHTFNFFGFPTETRDEAMETIDFLLDHHDIIHSEGTGTFSFEHNAPISKSPESFGVVNVKPKSGNVLELYYDYDVAKGLSASEASDMVTLFSELKKERKTYKYGGWIPREHLLVLLSFYTRDKLKRELEVLESRVHDGANWSDDLSWFTLPQKNKESRYFVVNSDAGKILETNKDAIMVLEFIPKNIQASTLISHFPVFEQVIRA